MTGIINMYPLSPLTISFEFFPPKTTAGIEKLDLTAQELTPYAPHFFSVTYGAGGSTRDSTIDTITRMHENTGVPIAPHLSCIGSSREEITAIIKEYRTLGMNRIVALRGDLPSGMGQTGELHYASDLVALVREKTGDYFHIDVAAYPEIHPQANTAHHDIQNLKRKFEAGANGAITQYFFNPDAYFYYLDECAKNHIYMPITPGIMPILQFSKLARFSDACGAEIPRWIRKRLESYGDDNASIKSFGIELVFNLCERLIHGGAPGLHFYTLNHAELCVELMQMLGVRVPKIKAVLEA